MQDPLGPIFPAPLVGPSTTLSTDPSVGSRVDRLRAWVDRNRAPLLLVALAITIPELLSGSTPVLGLLNPLAVLGLLGFYGAGSLLIRDLSIRWRKGWAGVLLLGLAYGIAEEGVATKTMVDPTSGPVGPLGVYGHFLGVNWVFATVIALFHALFSIALPILLVELSFPETRGHPFLSRRGDVYAFATLGVAVLWGYFFFVPNYFEGSAVLLALLATMGLCAAAAWFVPPEWFYPRTALPRRSPRWFFGLGVAYALGWVFFYLFADHFIAQPAIVVLAELALALIALIVVVREAGRTQNSLQKVCFAAGVLSWFVPWGFVVALALGDYLVVLPLTAVFWLLWDLRRRYSYLEGSRSPSIRLGPPNGPTTVGKRASGSTAASPLAGLW